MVIRCLNEKHKYLLFIDIEFDSGKLIQFAGLLFKEIDKETYQLMRSYNSYVSEKVCYPFAEYTKITNNFLEENGVPLEDVIDHILNDFLFEVPLSELQVISHGLRNDRIILNDNGVNLSTYVDAKGRNKPIDGYCTFKNGRRILERNKFLSLNDLAEESGFYMIAPHNAYNDVWATVAIYTFLRKEEEQKKNEVN